MKTLRLASFALLSLLFGTSCHGDDKPPFNAEPFVYMSDGLRISGLMRKPEGDGPFPVVLVNHGGSDPAKMVGGFLDFFAKNGFVALASDYRGCGNAEGRHEVAKGEINDILNLIKHARTLPYVDASRLAVWGFSHGGALALFAASRDPSVRAVVDVQGPVEMADAWRHWNKHQDQPSLKTLVGLSTIVGGTPDELPNAWRERSVLYAADKIKCPVLMFYSDNDVDTAVPTDQGTRMAAALEKAGNTKAKLTLLTNVGHGLNKQRWAELMKPILEFIQDNTKPSPVQ